MDYKIFNKAAKKIKEVKYACCAIHQATCFQYNLDYVKYYSKCMGYPPNIYVRDDYGFDMNYGWFGKPTKETENKRVISLLFTALMCKDGIRFE